MDEGKSTNLGGSGAIARDHSVAAGQSGVAVGGDVHGDVTVANITYQGVELQVRIPSSKAIARHRAALRDQLAADAQRRWGSMSVYIQEEGATLPIEASPYQTGRLGPRENLLQTLHAADQLLVLGEAGSGKTVALERLAWELCAGQERTVPVLIRLFRYEGIPLSEWVRATLQETGQLRLDDERALVAFLQEGDLRCFFLFDGLNEVSPPYRDRLTGELTRWMVAYPRHPLILTSRAQDELWRRLRPDVEQTVMVQPISDEQARAYLTAHLQERGKALYDRLDRRLRETARIPLLLWLIKEAGAVGESIPGNRGELYAHFVSRMLRRDADRRMDAEIPERTKQRALADLAYHLNLNRRLSCHCDEAMSLVARRMGEEFADKVIGACQRHGLLAGEETIWYAPHQTVQEYFAALALQELAAQEWKQTGWTWLWRAGWRMLTGREEGLSALAGDDWWRETFVQLAGLTDNADRLARGVARVNPWLAWWCVEEGREVSHETHEAVSTRSIRLLESGRVGDRRRAVATLGRMRNERVVSSLFQAAADPDTEVVGLAVQALLEMGEGVRDQALALARQPAHALHQAGLAYLEGLLGLRVVWVPPGPFLMGSDEDRDPQAFNYELPQHKVTLPGYWIGRYPVTVAKFRAFVEASGYQPTHRRILQGKDDHPVAWVTWRNAMAYCRWLSDETALPVTLPSEPEWEKAARGTDGRIYPWGDEPPDEKRCNFNVNVGGTTPVGQYSPRGDSPYGCADMAGNLDEWTRSLYKPYPYDPTDGREALEAEGGRVLRGGAFHLNHRGVRCAYRLWYPPDSGTVNFGFRVVVALGF